jgi:hypothetical protein
MAAVKEWLIAFWDECESEGFSPDDVSMDTVNALFEENPKDPTKAAGILSERIRDAEYEGDPGEMDGDHASALASAGWGTDEDYGYGDDPFDW